MSIATLTQLAEFDTIIDVRSPAEFTDDHIPCAVNCPVLDDAQRIQVGTLYKQVSPFAARKIGAVLVARNIAQHIETHFAELPREWRPLVYCWRGGQRSGAFTHILREIGWQAKRLDGGYKTWRREVIDQLVVLPERFRFVVIAGQTGSAKSRVLEALARRGAQVLHLEALALHKGSVLGNLPGQTQPSQRAFESALFAELSRFDTARPVFVEAESRRIGTVHLPEALTVAMRNASCCHVDATLSARIDFLLTDYAYALADPGWLRERLSHLRGMHSNETLVRWDTMVHSSEFAQLVSELLNLHYDPLYQRSQGTHYQNLMGRVTTDDLSPAGIELLATQCLAYASR
jgi:tRNA 2-selenouridine synthase